jgi:NAD(P)-dependent dehydrogenase (short-subunit alcohol dehydrogenase family)
MKNVLITGTSTGIGQTTALHLARTGYRVFAGMRNPESGGQLLTDTASRESLALKVVRLDVDDAQSCIDAVNYVVRSGEFVDILINNAGIGGSGAVEEVPETELRQIFETNFFGPMRLIQLVLPAMRERESGCIINITSISGLVVFAPMMSYTASKFALEAATETLALEVKPYNIRVSLIEPGVVLTPIFTKAAEPDLDSPYSQAHERLARYFEKRLESPSLPEDAAVMIQHAIETDKPVLRYLLGNDAKKVKKGRLDVSDEDFLELGQDMPLDQYSIKFKDIFNLDII